MKEHFLSEHEMKTFAARYFSRTVEELRSTELDWELHRILGVMTKSGIPNRFECFCIKVQADDGMSWAAEKVNEMVRGAAKDPKNPKFKIWALKSTGHLDAVPQIAELIGRKRFVALSLQHNITTGFILLRTWVTWAILGISLLGAYAVASFAGWGVGYAFLLLALVLSVLGLGIKNKIAAFALSDISGLSQKTNEMASSEAREDNYNEFVTRLSSELGKSSYPRFAIIDDWAKLDKITQEVIEHYFANYYQKQNLIGRFSEFWVVFEETTGDQLSRRRFNALDWEHTAFRNIRSFKIKLLTADEKQKLGDKLGISPKQLQEKVIKKICQDEKAMEAIEDRLRIYRDGNPKSDKIDLLDFLHLLSLNSRPIGISLSEGEFETLFVREKVRSGVLKYHFGLKELPTWNQIKRFMDDPVWKDAVEEVKIESKVEWKIRLEAVEAVEVLEQELGLPDARTGHLFWAVYWNDRLNDKRRPHPRQSVWIRKLSFHLTSSKVPDLPRYEQPSDKDHSRPELISRVFQDYAHILDGCLRTCVFEEVPHLLADAFRVLQEIRGPEKGYATLLNGFLAKCWEAYVVMLDDRILSVIYNINREIHQYVPAKMPSSQPERDILEALFYDTLPLPLEDRQEAKDYLYLLPTGKDATAESISDYIKMRSAWLTLLAQPLISSLPSFRLELAAESALEYLDKGLENILNRFPSPTARASGALNLIDLMSISNSIWCVSLRLLGERHIPVVIADKYQGDLHALSKYVFSKDYVLPRAEYFLMPIEKTISLLTEARKAQFDQSEYLENEFFFNAILSEIAATAVASLTVAFAHAQSLFVLPETRFVERVNSITQQVEAIFGYSKLPKIENADDFNQQLWIDCVDDFLEITGLVWERFGMEQLYNFTAIRRIQFKTICRTSEIAANVDALLKTGGLIEGNSLTEFLGNLAKANYNPKSREIQSTFFQSASRVAMRNHFSETIQQDLAIGVIFRYYEFAEDLSDFAVLLLGSRKNGTNLLGEIFIQMEEHDLPTFILNLYNCLSKIRRPEIVSAFEHSIQRATDNVRDPESREQINGITDYFNLAKPDVKIKTDNVLHTWENKKNDSLYPAVLHLCLSKGQNTDKLSEECQQVFCNDIYEQGINAHIILAHTYAVKLNELRDDAQIVAPLRYLASKIEAWESSLIAKINRNIYDLLSKYTESSAKQKTYEARAKYWWRTIEFIESKRFYQMLQYGNFFQVFLDVFEKMRIFGLETHGEWNGEAMPLETQEMPKPLVEYSDSNRVSADFLKVGTYLFTEKALAQPELDLQRKWVNRLARQYFTGLLSAVDFLPGLPSYIKEITANYARSFVEISKPEIDEF